jgi:hypothetical protein
MKLNELLRLILSEHDAMANTLLTNDIIAKLILMEFKNNLVLAKTCNRHYENVFSTETGTNVRIRRPTRLVAADGATLVVQNIQERFTNLTINQRKHVGIQLSSQELTLQLDDFQAHVIRPAMQSLANQVDASIYNSGTENIYNFVGTAGTAPATFSTANLANAKLNQFGVPKTDRYAILSENDGASMQSALYNTFNQDFNKKIILDSSMGRLAGFEWYTAQNVVRPAVLVGASFGSPIVSGAGQSGTTLNVSGLTAGITIKKGTLFTIAGVNSVNPISYVDTTQLANWVVSADVTADGGGLAAIPVNNGSGAGTGAQGIILTGPYQNVVSGPAASAVISFQARHTKNIAYHSECFTLAMINLYSPPPSQNTGAYFKNLVDKDANIALRMVRQYDIVNDVDICRVDALWGVQCFGEYGTIIMGS